MKLYLIKTKTSMKKIISLEAEVNYQSKIYRNENNFQPTMKHLYSKTCILLKQNKVKICYFQ